MLLSAARASWLARLGIASQPRPSHQPPISIAMMRLARPSHRACNRPARLSRQFGGLRLAAPPRRPPSPPLSP